MDVLKDIEIKVDDKTDIKKIKLETDYPQRVMRQGLLLVPCHALLSLLFCAFFSICRFQRLTIREIPDHELVACQADNVAHR